MDFAAILDGKATEAPEADKPAETPTPPPEQAPEPAPEAPPEAPPAEPAPEPHVRDETGRFAPLNALKDERAKRQELERRVAEMEAERQRAPAQAIPDPYDDPDGFAAYYAEQTAAIELKSLFNVSELMARDKHGDETVEAAMEWGAQRAQSNPGFRDEFLKAKNPIDWVVRQQKRDGLMSEVGDDPDAYVRRRAAELGLIAAPDAGVGAVPVPVQQQAPRPAAPPRSIASAPSSGGSVRDIPTGPMAGLDALFKG